MEPTSNWTDHHAKDAEYVRIHSHRLDSGTVTIGLSTIDRKNQLETTTLYLTKAQAKEVYAALDSHLASQ